MMRFAVFPLLQFRARFGAVPTGTSRIVRRPEAWRPFLATYGYPVPDRNGYEWNDALPL